MASNATPVIIEAALNGGTSPRANPNVPQTSEELTRDGLACLQAGAAVIHTHLARYDVRPEEAAKLLDLPTR